VCVGGGGGVQYTRQMLVKYWSNTGGDESGEGLTEDEEAVRACCSK
jgi:hypothetical protein